MSEKLGTNLQEKEEVKVKRPKMYNVILLNDDYTTFDFVVKVLVSFFNKSFIEAEKIAMEIHQNKKGICGTFPKNVAEMKSKKTNQYSKSNKFPLKSIVEAV